MLLKVSLFIVGAVVCTAAIVYALVSSLATSAVQNDTSNGPLAVKSLKFLVIISRHGNRGSNFDYPGDPYLMNDTRYWPYGALGITPQGRKEMFDLGVRVRSLYSGFIPEIYNTDDILARSTYMDRVLMSGEAFLAGLYPPKGFQVWDTGLDWQPTALYSDSPDRTPELLLPGSTCDVYHTNFLAKREFIFEKYEPVITKIREYLQNVTGVNATLIPVNIGFMLWDKISNEVSEKLPIPEWAYAFYPDQLYPLISEEYRLTAACNDEITRLIVGEMYEQLLDAMIQKVNGSLTPDRKVLYYSSHDTSIVSIQRILGTPWESILSVVRPGSALILELHQNNVTLQYRVQGRYIDGFELDKTPQILNITSDFNTLVNNTQKFLHVNYEQECQVTT